MPVAPDAPRTPSAASGTVPSVPGSTSARAGSDGSSPSSATPAPSSAGGEPFVAYLFAHFVGESTAEGEAIYLTVSRGSTVLDWQPLNGGRPVLESTLGERGLRDPFLLRTREGDRFVLLATDLRVHGDGNFRRAQERGSRSLMVWESADLVHWGEQRMVEVSSPDAGNTWAPEAVWDEGLGRYAVYWASNLYPGTPPEERRVEDSYNRMMVATTSDFVTFSEPRVWIDVPRAPGYGSIDSTVVPHDGVWHRFTKDERPDVMQVFQERSPDLLRPTAGSFGSAWELVAERIGDGVLSHGEGPTVVRSLAGDRWYLFQDWPPYGGGTGYVVFETTDLDSGRWTAVAGARLPTTLRHGSVVPITQRELDRLLSAWGDDGGQAGGAPGDGADDRVDPAGP